MFFFLIHFSFQKLLFSDIVAFLYWSLNTVRNYLISRHFICFSVSPPSSLIWYSKITNEFDDCEQSLTEYFGFTENKSYSVILYSECRIHLVVHFKSQSCLICMLSSACIFLFWKWTHVNESYCSIAILVHMKVLTTLLNWLELSNNIQCLTLGTLLCLL